jgi:hypothetical protein
MLDIKSGDSIDNSKLPKGRDANTQGLSRFSGYGSQLPNLKVRGVCLLSEFGKGGFLWEKKKSENETRHVARKRPVSRGGAEGGPARPKKSTANFD